MIERRDQQFEFSRAENQLEVSHHAGKVLVVDDNATLLPVLKEILNRANYQALVAKNADEALAELQADIPDMILCDVMMPGMDGYTFFNRVRGSEQWAHIPFVFLTALGAAKEIRFGKSQGCDDYLVKPFNPDDLLAVVQGKVALGRERKQIAEKKLNNYQRTVVNTLSHEFRTPLVAIHTGAELLLDQFSRLDEQRIKKLVETIHRGGQRLERLVSDFMLLQQIESGASTKAHHNSTRPRIISEMVELAIDRFIQSPQTPRTQIIFKSPQPESAQPQINVFDIQVIDALERILHNADKFSHVQGIVEVKIAIDASHAKICVRDYGPGLSPELAEKATAKFTQIDRDKFEQQGCGIGLTITRHFVELNGGSLKFNNPDGGGLEVILTFPLVS